MNRGKEPLVSLCEKKFLVEALKEGKRVDGRDVYDYRELNISLGRAPGEVEIMLGKTRVLAVVNCQVVVPKPHRPTEGLLFFNVELSPMASPSFEVGKISTTAIELNRVLERCQKESRAVDTESLCIIAGEKVWEIRVDIHVLDHHGNVLDCASIASIMALKHFRRPDVTVVGQEATIHPVSERDPVPLNVNHSPMCFSFAFFLEGGYMVVDPSLEEEQVMEGKLIVGMNIHQEVCVLQMNGGVAILPEQVIRCTKIAASKCMEITNKIKEVLSGKKSEDLTLSSDIILHSKRQEEEVEVVCVDQDEPEKMVQGDAGLEDISSGSDLVECLGPGTAELKVGMGGPTSWEVLDAIDLCSEGSVSKSDEEDSGKIDKDKTEDHSKSSSKSGKLQKPKEDNGVVIVSDSEEEETALLTPSEIESGGNRTSKLHSEATESGGARESVQVSSEKMEASSSEPRKKRKKKGGSKGKSKSVLKKS